MNVEQLESCPWFRELLGLIQHELDRSRSDDSRIQPNLQHELQQVRDRIAGLRESLANPKLAARVRQCLEADLGDLLEKEAAVQQRLQAEEQRPQAARKLVDPEEVVERLQRLHEVLRSGTASEINVELSHYIDRIECSADGAMSLRICPFGMAPRVLSLVAAAEPSRAKSPEPLAAGVIRGTPRRRAVRRVEDRNAAHFVADPNRFRNVPEDWFWVETFRQPERSKTWPDAHAEEVHAMRFTPDGIVNMNLQQLKAHFVRSKPTLREAIRIAEERRSKGGNSASADPTRPPEKDAQ